MEHGEEYDMSCFERLLTSTTVDRCEATTAKTDNGTSQISEFDLLWAGEI